jgi:monoamine oxidase
MDAPLATRRDVLLGLGASAIAGLTGCGATAVPGPIGGAAHTSGSPAPSTADVIVVGAGVTGLGAARQLRSAGYSVIVLEAAGRLGGRCYCDNTTFSVPVDIGAEWFHQVLSANPLVGLAIEASKRNPKIARPVADDFPRLLLDGSKAVDPIHPTPRVKAALARTIDMNVEINLAGSLAGNVHPDVSCAAATAIEARLPWYGFGSAASGVGRTGTAMKNSSCLDYYNFSLLSPAPVTLAIGDDWLIRTGMGNFIATLAQGTDVRLNAPVTEIAYTRQGVKVTAGERVYRAKAAIVTTSVGILREGTIDFSPDLPTLHQRALAHLGMGFANKYLLQFKPGAPFHLPSPGYNAFCTPLLDTSDLPLFQINLWKSGVVLCLVEADQAEQFERMSEDRLVKTILRYMNVMWPGVGDYYAGTISHSAWAGYEWSLGAYSYAYPGWAHARTDLLTPIGGTLFFAGEATSEQSHGSLHGGYLTGVQQANAVIATLQVLPKRRALDY